MVKLSVVVSTYNRAAYLIKCLEHLKDQQEVSRSDYEVIVVNNNSPDDTDIKVNQFLAEHPNLPWTYVIEANQGLSYARNRGIHESGGEIIAFLDDDAYVNGQYCKTILGFFGKQPDAMAIGGRIMPAYEGQEPKWMSRFLWPLVAALDLGNEVKEFKGTKFPIGANMAFRKKAFDQYGSFSNQLGRKGTRLEGGEEKDFIYRLKKNREPIYYVPSLCVHHIIPEKRLSMDYIRSQAIGVGLSERKRLRVLAYTDRLSKIIGEAVKIGGTVILTLFYLAQLKASKAVMLVRIRFWILKGYFSTGQ